MIKEYTWHWWFRRMHPVLAGNANDPQKLRLVIGSPRSGTSWLSQVLAQTPTPLRFFNEPLHHIIPRLSFSQGHHHVSIRYQSKLPDQHRLLTSYRSLTARAYNWPSLGLDERFLLRNDRNWEYCLVKEVHGLLATEAVINGLKCPTIIITRDPLYIVDSMFSAGHRLHTLEYFHEFNYVRERDFLHRFFPRREQCILDALDHADSIRIERRRLIMQSVIVTTLIQEMFHKLALELKHVHLVQYAMLCQEPYRLFRSAALFLSLDWDEQVTEYLSSTMHGPSESDNPYSIFRNTLEQRGRQFRVLGQDEISKCEEVLNLIGLIRQNHAQDD